MFDISVTQTKELQDEANEAAAALHTSLKSEAEDHTRLLMDLQMCNAEYDHFLRQNYYRKQVVMQILKESEAWKRISSSMTKN